MKRLTDANVFSGLTTPCRLAIWPTSRSPPFVYATTDGVVRAPGATAEVIMSTSSCTGSAHMREQIRLAVSWNLTMSAGLRALPSTFVTMVGLPPSMAATAELVVPRSMPTTCKTQAPQSCQGSLECCKDRADDVSAPQSGLLWQTYY